MRYWLISNIILLLGLVIPSKMVAATQLPKKDSVETAKDTTLYQGMCIKLDLATPAIVPAIAKGETQQYEIAMNWRLRYRYYPTLEIGYSYDKREQTGLEQARHGGFMRIGADINALRKHPESPHALLVGLRVGAAVDNYLRCDSWGEIAAGCQVGIYKGLRMGWHVRYKILFTRQQDPENILPPYIPGFGNRSDTQWGLSYYIGYAF